MNKFLRRCPRKLDQTPTLVNVVEDDQDGWAVLPAHEVDTLIDSRVYFTRGIDVYVTARVVWGTPQPVPYRPEQLLFRRH